MSRVIFYCSSLLLTACAVGPDYQRPADPKVSHFNTTDIDYLSNSQVEIQWWQQLNEPQLNQLIEQAIQHNHDLAIARANVRAARALLSEGQLSALPSVTLNGEVTRQKTPSGSGTTFDSRSNLYDAGLDAAWELDFFGRVRRSNEALAANYESLLAGQNQVAITVTAEVARSYVELRGAQLQLDVARRNAEIQQRSLQLTQALLDGGRGTRLDVAQARAQLESTQASIPLLEIAQRRSIHRLSVLVGKPPQHLNS
ncbi:MAG: TolC family protein, partial [Nevskiales bacterium]